MVAGAVSVHAPTLAAALGAAAGFVAFFLYGSVFEYVLHRWLMHRRRRLVPYPYQMHALLHHRVFGDATYQVREEADRHAILFEWWQAPVLLAVHAPLPWAAQWSTGLPLFWPGMLALAAYYACYEGLHWCMHNPTGRWLERTRLFRRLDAHHRLHHRVWRVNFNVVLPLGDLVFGTLRPAHPGAGARPDPDTTPWPARLLLAVGVLGGVVLSGHRAGAGLPGYAEWVLWKATETAAPAERPGGSRVEFEWVLGPYPRLPDCEDARDREGDRLTRGSAARPAEIARIRLLCVPDWVDPRRDRRWQ